VLEPPVITLTTDFGLKDPFVGVMKGVILKIIAHARIIDITHHIARHSILEASQTISESHTYFPSGSIHVVVVDPGVGSMRRPLLVEAGTHYFIGPDNGVFSQIYEDTDPQALNVFHLTSEEHFLPAVSSTFHGRDIFAPVAAWLAKGTAPEKLGSPIDDAVAIIVPKPVFSGSTISGIITSIDNFGNAISNIRDSDLVKLAPPESGKTFKVTFGKEEFNIVRCYEENEGSRSSAIINSSGRLEIFVCQGSAAEKHNIRIGDSVSISLVQPI
jgi:S-adenosylmethionine hydrolase